MGVNGKIVKCAISWKWLIGWKFGTHGLGSANVMYFSCLILLLQFGGGLYACKVFDVKIFKTRMIIQFQPNFTGSTCMVIRGNIGYYFFGWSAKFKTIYDSLKFWAKGAGNFKMVVPLWFSSHLSAKLHEDISYHGVIQSITSLDSC